MNLRRSQSETICFRCRQPMTLITEDCDFLEDGVCWCCDEIHEVGQPVCQSSYKICESCPSRFEQAERAAMLGKQNAEQTKELVEQRIKENE